MSDYNRDNKYQRGYDLAVTESIFSSGVSWAAAGASIGSFEPGLGQGIGAAVGFGLGMIFGGVTARADYRNKVQDELSMMQIKRKQATKERNYAILSSKNLIKSTKSGFDSTYGAGMYDKYNALFTDMFKRSQGSDQTLHNIFSNMQYDKVAGTITSSTEGINIGSLDYSMSITDINEAYYEYFENELRNADTQFGLSMEALKSKEGETLANYHNDINAMNIEFSKQFYDTFIGRVMESSEGELAMGKAASDQGSSGLRGGKLTSLQQFRNDLAAVAYSSSLEYLIGSYENSMNRTQGSYINAISELRHQGDMSIAGQLSNLVAEYNKMNQGLLGGFKEVNDKEGYIKETTSEMKEAESFLNDSSANAGAGKVNITDDITSNTMEELF